MVAALLLRTTNINAWSVVEQIIRRFILINTLNLKE